MNPSQKRLLALTPSSHRWAVLLAGGEGQRMRPFVERWLGESRPKQYCSFYGERSMLEDTARRAAGLVAPDHILTVIGRGHSRFLREGALPGRIIEQPESLGTGPGVFLAATYIFAEDPEALVIVLPSDHFVQHASRFTEHANSACEVAERFPDKLVLLGAMPDSAEPDYGWIEPGPGSGSEARASGHAFQDVLSFHEKPSPTEANNFFSSGYLWNTMIIAAQIRALWLLGQRCMPAMMGQFETLRRVLRAIREGRVDGSHELLALTHIYRNLTSADFSQKLLELVPEQIMVSPMEDVGWSDWGKPSRIIASLDLFGRCPNFPLSCVDPQTACAGIVKSDNDYWRQEGDGSSVLLRQ